MNEECVVGVYDSLDGAGQAVHILRRGGVPVRQVSVVASGPLDRPELVHNLPIADDSLRDAAIGAGLGGLLGVVAGIAATAVAGVGVVFALGPFAVGLTGATVGAYLGGLIGWGVHRQHIEHYEQCVKNGKVLVIANGTPAELDGANRMLKETNAVEVRLYARTSSESPEVLAR
ncbi:MAG TPA: hypothetical protein VNH11_02015 [Pirellulales bacterium]|nr:hypothetical protein [Pirellulales bacterium]